MDEDPIQETSLRLPMVKEMQPVGLRSDEGLVCVKCGRRAWFLCPLGAFCPTDALIAAARHGWIPTQIRYEGRDADTSDPSAAD
jgi:hypothetical protein